MILAILFGNFYTASAANDIDVLKKTIEATTDKTELARLHKKLGDHYVSQEDFKQASGAYMKALSLSRDTFPADERVKIAVYLSWADRLKEAIEELDLIILENPSNLNARIHLARTLSWAGQLTRSLEEADRVLKESPENKEALLVKANALNWQGDHRTAISIFKKLLDKEEDFDSRIGLTYAFLSTGNKTGAEESSLLLKPKYPYQERELKKLIDVMNRESRPKFDIRYNYYKDSDDNRLNRGAIFYSFWVDNWNLDFNYRHTDAKDKTRDKRAEDLFFKIYSKLTESVGIGGGLGFNQLGNGETRNFLTGHIRADANISNATIGASIARDVLSDTAQIIENRIKITNVGLYISKPLTDRLSLYGGYNFRDYSDKNNAHDLQFVPRYAVYANPRIAVGYRFRYLNFHRQSGSGYFDPNDYISNRIFGSLYLEREKFYASMEPFIGHQYFRRNGIPTSDFIGGGAGTLGFKPKNNIAIELNAEGGNFSAGTAAGFNYYLIGIRFVYLLF